MSKKPYVKTLKIDKDSYFITDLKKAAEDSGFKISELPYSLRILFENILRLDYSPKKAEAFKNWLKEGTSGEEISFTPARVLMQDFTGVPAIVDLASMRDAALSAGGDPLKVNPSIPVDLVIDHSVQVDYFGKAESFSENVKKEMERNLERYRFLKWGQSSFSNFRVVPPGTGICHQVNLEYLAKTIFTEEKGGELWAYPDTLVGTDSHTTMVNGLAVLGWGVGGIEAEASALGDSISMLLPEVVGFELTGKLREGVTATDLVLTVTEILRKKNVVGKFVEFFGEGASALSVADRATVANMAPEYGATCGFFPIDSETLKYLKLTGRENSLICLVEKYAKENYLFADKKDEIKYTEILKLDLGSVETRLAGPKRPQDGVFLSAVPQNFALELPSLAKKGGTIDEYYKVGDRDFSLRHGSLAIAAITSCTNTSNPSVMVCAGLLAKKALELGLSSKKWVKTSLAPGSKVVTEYLKSGGLQKYLDALGFNLVGYGCTTCIGNSGPLDPEIEKTIADNSLVVASVLSGNRNFEGRINPSVRANYLASPPLVVAYALAGDVNIDLATEPLGKSSGGREIYLRDLWPTETEIKEYIEKNLKPEIFLEKYRDVFSGDSHWKEIEIPRSKTYSWEKNSTYIKNPPYFEGSEKAEPSEEDIKGARILAIFGDSITTDHISPAGSIAKGGPAGLYLKEKGVEPQDFNSYGARRGNHEVMVRGTFANIRIKNELCPGIEGGFTVNAFSGGTSTIYETAELYKSKNIGSVIFAGKEYGTGSSRDWAAKGTKLLGVKAVIAESFERIHRSNLVGMGVLPLTFKKGATRKDLSLDGTEEIDIKIKGSVKPGAEVECAIKKNGSVHKNIKLDLNIFTEKEVEYIKSGSILRSVLKSLIGS